MTFITCRCIQTFLRNELKTPCSSLWLLKSCSGFFKTFSMLYKTSLELFQDFSKILPDMFKTIFVRFLPNLRLIIFAWLRFFRLFQTCSRRIRACSIYSLRFSKAFSDLSNRKINPKSLMQAWKKLKKSPKRIWNNLKRDHKVSKVVLRESGKVSENLKPAWKSLNKVLEFLFKFGKASRVSKGVWTHLSANLEISWTHLKES